MEKYYSFDLWIERIGAERFRASVAGLESTLNLGEADETLDAPFAPGELEDLLSRLRQPLRDLNVAASPSPLPRKIEEEIGRRLFRAIFQGRIEQFWRQARSQTHVKRAGLRLRLRISDPDLARWPWEFLFDPDTGFLALSEETPIIRYTEMVTPPTPTTKSAFRILVVTSHPQGCTPLQVEEEWRELREALRAVRWRRRVVVERLDRASLSALNLKLQEKRFQVLHFIGHGSFSGDEGVIHFETEGQGVEGAVTGGQLATILRDHASIRLVVLNMCDAGIHSLQDPFGGVAQALVKTGVPTVVAMRSRFSDSAAIAFTRFFYGALALGQDVDVALAKARKGLFSKGFDPEWAIPVLYSRLSRPRNGIWKWVLVVVLALALAAASYALLRDLGDKLIPPGPLAQQDLVTPLSPVARGSSRGCPPLKLKELDIHFKRINPGDFEMGDASEGKDTKPHKVSITKPFCMNAHEITQRQWRRIMKENPSVHTGDDRRPVENVSWNATEVFVSELQALDPAANFRHATEAEWEYAARAGSTFRFSFGDDPSRLPRYGNCESRGTNDRYDGPAPVGSFEPNAWGLYDMHGNVSEWVADWYAPYGEGAVSDPKGPPVGTERVRRGGSYEIIAKNCGSAKRNQMKPDHSRSDVGFRIVRDVVD